jgi:hypothetical protein
MTSLEGHIEKHLGGLYFGLGGTVGETLARPRRSPFRTVEESGVLIRTLRGSIASFQGLVSEHDAEKQDLIDEIEELKGQLYDSQNQHI